MSDEKHPYRIAIISGVAVLLIWSVVPGWSRTFHAIGALLGVFTWRIPVWLIVLVIVILVALIAWVRHRWAAFDEEDDSQSQYCEDRFFDAVWRWSNYGVRPVIMGFFCPRCDLQLIRRQLRGGYHAAELIETKLFCERCNVNITEVDGTFSELEDRVIREIERKVRTGEYKQVIK